MDCKPLIFTTVHQFFDKYERCNIPVSLLAIHEDYQQMNNYGPGIDLMIGRIENGCFIEDATGEWWIQMPLDKRYFFGKRYFEAGDKSLEVALNPRYPSWLASYIKGDLHNIKVHHEDDNLLTSDGILIGSRIKEEG